MKWRRKDEISNEQVMSIANSLDINELLARILLNRGKSLDEIRIIIKDIDESIIEPLLLTNAEKAAKVIASYCKNPNAEIWIFGDYDVDGVTSGYIMTSALREVAVCPIEVYYPERTEGYGLSMDFCKKLTNCYSDLSKDVLVITVDNGITCVDEIQYLKANNIEVIVTDHHVAKEVTPNCIIVDPHNNNEPDTFKHLAGCGVAFKVAQLVQREFEVYNMGSYVFAVAIGTIADVMPMSIENIAFVKYGLEMMNSDECPKGMKAMMEFMGKKSITPSDIAWELSPRINACGRMGNVNLASQLFFVDDLPFGENIENVINKIEELNTLRKDYTKKAQKLVEELDIENEPICLLDASEYPEGIIGVIANKVAEKYKRPTIVLAGKGDTMTGSARSVNGISLQEILQIEQENGNVIKFGGHEVAAGLQVERSKFEELKKSLCESVQKVIESSANIEQEEPELIIDELINLNHINEATYELVNTIPYDNNSFTTPTFALCDVVIEKVSISKNNPSNICFTIKDDTGKMSIWGWGMAPLYESLGKPNRIHIAGTIDRDFMRPNNFTMKIIDILGAA